VDAIAAHCRYHGAMGNNSQTPPSAQVQKSYQHCMQLARHHYENFPTASRLISPRLRPAVAAIYAFARTADDMADEGTEPAEKRLKQLDAWEVLLERCTQEEVDHPVFLALGDAIRRFDLPVACLRDLLTAFRMDVSIHAYASVDELLFYCRHSANPVGRRVLALHGIGNPAALSASDAVCSALQLANFWQDLSRDLPNGRCYLPDEWLALADLSHTDLLAGELSPELSARLQPVLKHAIDYTQSLMQQGRGLPSFLPFRLRLQIVATMRGGSGILQRVARCRNPLHTRPSLGSGFWLRSIPGVLFTALLPPAATDGIAGRTAP